MPRPALLAWLVLAVAAFIATRAHADAGCYQWRANTTPSGAMAWQNDPTVAAALYMATCPTTGTGTASSPYGCNPTGNIVGFTLGPYTPTGSIVGNWPSITQVGYEYDRNNGGAPIHNTIGVGIASQLNPAGCPVCPAAGTKRNSIMEDGAQVAGTGVNGSDGCNYKVCSDSATVMLTTGGFKPIQCVESTGTATGQAPTTVGDEPATSDECATGGSNVACGDGKNCGQINGDQVCVGTIPPGSCVGYDSGGVACVSTAATPPAPDNGTAGTPAAPDATVTRGSTTINYYTSSTVNNSSGVPTTGPPTTGNPGGSDSGGGTCVGDECGPPPDETCPEGEDCSGTLPDEFDEVCTFGECAEAFYGRIANAPILAAVSTVGSSFPAGSCPAVNVTMFDETMSLSEPICDIWTNQIAGAVSVLMLIIFGWVATRIVLSA